ncbi:MAG TPA: ABC transporter substrate-binding protein [Clostridia bacterium]|nr:ABC transporter substrate-binding protein [Clostridia bacterium]
MNRKTLLWLSLLILVSLSVWTAGCSKKAEEIKIGYSGPLSGDGAAWGQQEKFALEVAEKEINDAGGVLGRPIKVIMYDDRGDKVEVVNTVKRLITQDKVVAIITHNYSSCSLAVAPVVEEYKIPTVTNMATHPTVTVPEPGKVRPYYFRATFTTEVEGGALAVFVAEQGFKNAAVIYDLSQDYSMGLKDGFIKKFKSLGGNIVAEESIKGGEEDFRAVLTSIQAKNPDVIILTTFYKEGALIVKQARELGIQTQFAGGAGLESDVLAQLAGKAVEGMYVITHFTPEDPRPIVQEFRKKFKEKANLEPDANGATARDSLYMIVDAIKRANSTDPQAIRDALEKTANLEGATGTITINPATHNPDMDTVATVVKDGKLSFVKRVKP